MKLAGLAVRALANRLDSDRHRHQGYAVREINLAEVKLNASSFLHGVEVIETTTGPAPITVVKSSVIGLVGTAPTWNVQPPAAAPGVNVPTLVSSARDASNFGAMVQGYTIPYALNAILQQGAGQVIVVNVFDPSRHVTALVLPETFRAPVQSTSVIWESAQSLCCPP